MPKSIHSSEPVSIPEAYELLKQREQDAIKQGQELTYMQKEALEHARITTRTSAAEARDLVKRLTTNFKLSKLGAIALTNTLPDTIDEVRQILDVEGKRLETEVIENILNEIMKVNRLDIPEEPEPEYPDEDLFPEYEKEIDQDSIPEDIR